MYQKTVKCGIFHLLTPVLQCHKVLKWLNMEVRHTSGLCNATFALSTLLSVEVIYSPNFVTGRKEELAGCFF